MRILWLTLVPICKSKLFHYTIWGIQCLHFNFRPLVLIGGGYDQDQTSMGGFQEWPQVS